MNDAVGTVVAIPLPVLPCGAIAGIAVARLLIEIGRVLWRRRQDRRVVAARLAPVPLLPAPRTLAEVYALCVPDTRDMPDEDPDELPLRERL